MNAISMDFKTGKTSDPHILLLNLADKIGLKRLKYIGLSNLGIY